MRRLFGSIAPSPHYHTDLPHMLAHNLPFTTSVNDFITMCRYLRIFCYINCIVSILLSLNYHYNSPRTQDYMLRLKNFLAPFTTSAASNMVHSKPAPAPTVQTAIKEKESLTAGEGG
jgi:hypothetical protein